MKPHDGEIPCIGLIFLKKTTLHFEQICTKKTHYILSTGAQPKIETIEDGRCEGTLQSG